VLGRRCAAVVAAVVLSAAVPACSNRGTWFPATTNCPPQFNTPRTVSRTIWPPLHLPKVRTEGAAARAFGIPQLVLLPGGHPSHAALSYEATTGDVLLRLREGTSHSVADVGAAFHRSARSSGWHVDGTSSQTGSGTTDERGLTLSRGGITEDAQARDCGGATLVEVAVQVPPQHLGVCAKHRQSATCAAMYAAVTAIATDPLSPGTMHYQRVQHGRGGGLVLDYPHGIRSFTPYAFVHDELAGSLRSLGWTIHEPAPDGSITVPQPFSPTGPLRATRRVGRANLHLTATFRGTSAAHGSIVRLHIAAGRAQ
jgi:hypothetical protein